MMIKYLTMISIGPPSSGKPESVSVANIRANKESRLAELKHGAELELKREETRQLEIRREILDGVWMVMAKAVRPTVIFLGPAFMLGLVKVLFF